MKSLALRNFVVTFVFVLSAAGMSASAQSQALDGQIEGWITDEKGAAVAGASVFAKNTGTGLLRSTVTESTGFYRILLLPLGTYQLSVEAPNFKRSVRGGITLSTGETATIDFILSPGDIEDTVTITAEDPIADTGRTDIGFVLSNKETENLPLVSRNPLNFVFQQVNVNGRPNRGILNFPIVSANGYRSRVNYQLDGSNSTHPRRAGLRLLVIPETFVKEVQFISNAFAPEFGNTPGVIMNLVTPSGTNDINGSFAYLFRPPLLYSRPFGYPVPKLQDSRYHDLAFEVGLPLRKDNWHLYAGYEKYLKDDKGIPNRLLTITETNKAGLIAAGLPASIFPPAIPTLERGDAMLFRSDLQLTENHRLAGRYNYANIFIENSINGGLNTLDRNVDTYLVTSAIAAQLASYSTRLVNELRFQYARRTSGNRSNRFSATGPTIVVRDVAHFGAPEAGDAPPDIETILQVQNNLTRTTGAHVAKFGGGFASIRMHNHASVFARYTFASVEEYAAARNGTNPRSYQSYNESSGDPESRLGSTYWNLFAQDDWKVTARLKLTFGLRYDLYRIPDAATTGALPVTKKFKIDSDNIAPRIAAVFVLRQGRRPSILRVGSGLYYETPWLEMYDRARRQNGNPTYFSFSVAPTSPGAPNFPAVFPQGLQLSPQDIDTVSPDFENLYAIHANAQFEQAIGNSSSFTIGYVHSGGRHIPVYRSINYIPVRFLSDGRPIFARPVNPATRYDPRFNNITVVESVGRSRYDAFNAQFRTRMSWGLSVSAHYTLSKATDDAPEQNVVFPNPNNSVLGNPWDRRYEYGRSFTDQGHTFVGSVIASPTFKLRRSFLRALLNNNQISATAYANSGSAFNIVSTDINQDGLFQDRPLGVARNSGTTPPLFSVDLRYSRLVPIGEKFRLEVFADFANVFNVNSIVQYNNTTVPTAVTGELIDGIPDFRARNQSTSLESRQTQIGIKFFF
jgi:hypothetical protein